MPDLPNLYPWRTRFTTVVLTQYEDESRAREMFEHYRNVIFQLNGTEAVLEREVDGKWVLIDRLPK